MAERNRWFDMALGILFMAVGLALVPSLWTTFITAPLIGFIVIGIPFLAGLILFIVGLRG